MQNDIKEKTADYIKRHVMIKKGDSVCVAVSGGADSMCLLFLLNEMSPVLGISLSAVHVEHGIRGQSSIDDMEYVKRQCGELDIPLKTVQVDIPAAAEIAGTTLEETARNERYRIFSELKADRIALAHHINDQAETFIFNSIRGTGLRGLRGIVPVRGRYIRPLLCLTRQEIESYCLERHIEYREDITNSDIDIPRNRIRHMVIPELLKINEEGLRHISEAAEDISAADEYIRSAVDKAFEKCIISPADRPELEIIIDLDQFDRLHRVEAAGVIMKAMTELAGRSKDIARRHIEAVLTLANGQSGHHLDLIYGIKAYKEFRHLVLKKAGKYEISNPDKPAPQIEYSILQKKDVPMERILDSGNYTKYIDYATIRNVSALEGRYRQTGDYISIKDGRKSLKDLLIDEKIPSGRRRELFLITQGSEIVWIPELGRIGERFKITDKTEKILRMGLKNGRQDHDIANGRRD